MAIVGKNGAFVEGAEPEQEQVDIPSAPSIMQAPDGKLYNVPASSYKVAIENGWKISTPEAIKHEDDVNKYVKDNDSALNVFGTHFANEATLGAKEYVENKSHTDEENLIREEGEKRLQDKHPVARWAGNITGFAAPLLIPGVGEVGEAARLGVLGTETAAKVAARATEEAVVKSAAETAVKQTAEISLTKRIAANAAKYATEASIYSSPKAAAQIAYGDPEQAAETMLWGVGLSAVAGAGAEGLTSAMSAASHIPANALSKLSEKQANGISYLDDVSRNVYGISDKLADELGPPKLTTVIDRADELGFGKLNSAQREAAVESLLSTTTTKLNEHLNYLNKYVETSGLQSPTEISNSITASALKDFPEIEQNPSFIKKLDTFVSSIKGDVPTLNINRISEKSPLADYVNNIIDQKVDAAAANIYNTGKDPAKFADYMQNKQDKFIATTLLQNPNKFKGTGRLPLNLSDLLSYKNTGITITASALGIPHAAPAIIATNYIIKHLLKDTNLLGISVSTLRKIVKDPASAPIIGGLLAKEGREAFERQLNSIPSYLTSKPTALTTDAIIRSFTGSDKDQYTAATTKINRMNADLSNTTRTVGHIASAFNDTSIQLSSQIANKKLSAISYLASQIPKNDKPKQPFQKDDWSPTSQQKHEFNQKLATVLNPMSVFHKISNNTITSGEVAALQTVYPKIYQSMVQKVLELSSDPSLNDISHEKRVALSKFTNLPLDQSYKNMFNIQAAIAEQPQQPRKSSRKARSDSLLTPSQRRTYT